MKFVEEQEVIELARSPKNKTNVLLGRNYESRLRLFTEAKFKEDLKDENGWKEFREFMKEVLGDEKDSKIKRYIQYPLSSVNITESLMSDLYKVFDAGNSYFNIETVKKNGGEELQKIFKEINLTNWIQETGKKVLRNQPNTVIVLDRDENGKPYLIPVSNDRLLDIELRQDGHSCEYISFIHSKRKNESDELEVRIAIYDDENYYVVLKKDSDYTLESKQSHQAGYCPARMFLDKPLNSNCNFSRKSPIALALGKIAEWQYFDIYKFYTDHYAPFPVTEMVRSKCGLDNCKDGIIYDEDTYYDDGQTKTRISHRKCKVCGEKNKIGVGTNILLDPVEEGEKSASGMFRMISNDVRNLEYIQDKLDSTETYIKHKVVGIDNIVSKEAVNEKQVQGSFESRTNVLLGIKTNLDNVYQWIAETIGRLKGGKPLDVTANYGTEWYLISEDELQERYKKATEIGLPTEEVSMIYNQLIETKYKGNPEKIERLKLMEEINPCPHDSWETKVAKRGAGVITESEMLVSERLTIFVKKFEEDNGSIVDFGSELDRRQKVKVLKETINKYSDEHRENNQPEPIGGGEEADE